MNFLGMGPMELMLIMVLALIVFGPGKLPEIAGQVGKAVRDVRRATTDLSSEFNRTLSLELEEKKEAEAASAASLPPAPSVASAPAIAGTAEPAVAAHSTTVDVPADGSVVVTAASGGSESSPAANGQGPVMADTSAWHWEEAWKPGADDSLAPPDRRSSTTSGAPVREGTAPTARKDMADLVPPY